MLLVALTGGLTSFLCQAGVTRIMIFVLRRWDVKEKGISHISEIKQYELYWHSIKKRLTRPLFQALTNQVRQFIFGI